MNRVDLFSVIEVFYLRVSNTMASKDKEALDRKKRK